MNIPLNPEKTLDDHSIEINIFDEHLAIILSRLAAIQGEAIAKHRFIMSSVNLHGANIEDFNPSIKAKELWLTAFPNGEVYQIDRELNRQDLPGIWISQDRKKVLLLKGMLIDGSISAEDPEGHDVKLKIIHFLSGDFLALRTHIQSTHLDKAPRSARDWFFYAIKKRKSFFIEGVVASLVISVLALVISFYTMQVYDRVVPTHSTSTLTVLTVGAFIGIVMELLTKSVRSRIMDQACKAIDIELSSVFFGHMLSIRMDARPNSVGTFASQIKQFEMVRNFMTSSTLFILADMPFVIFFIVIIWSIGGVIALVPISLLPISIFSGFYAKWKMSKLAEDQLTESNQKNGLLVEAIDGIEAIKAVGGEWKMLEYWKRLTQKSADKELKIREASTMASSVTQSVQQISYILLIAAGVFEITAGHITMGALMACSIISNRALSPISQISGFIVQWQHAKAALSGLDEMMKLPLDKVKDEQLVIPESCRGNLRLEQVAFSYLKDQPVLEKTNLLINPGDHVAIIGPVGSGKSTLIKMISGLYKPSEGQVFLDEVDMAHIAPEFLRESIGYLTQDIRLFSGTLRYNLTLGLASPSDSQILDACSKTGLDKVIKNHPKGLELPIYEGGRGLSGGQRQLVGLTRMLIAKPKILLLDEPTASMDGDLELRVIRSLFAASSPQTLIILSTHKLALLGFVNRVIVLDRGKIVLSGPRDEVLAKLNPPAAQPKK
jgi:ATP-binding cassette subfamily C protein LapB